MSLQSTAARRLASQVRFGASQSTSQAQSSSDITSLKADIAYLRTQITSLQSQITNLSSDTDLTSILYDINVLQTDIIALQETIALLGSGGSSATSGPNWRINASTQEFQLYDVDEDKWYTPTIFAGVSIQLDEDATPAVSSLSIPSFSIPGGEVDHGETVTISTSAPATQIHYAKWSGTSPPSTYTTFYGTSLVLTATGRIWARASNGSVNSAWTYEEYTISAPGGPFED